MDEFEDNSEFDPTAEASLYQELKNCSVGKSPTGFPKIHIEMLPGDLIKMIAYDPRSIPLAPRPGQHNPHHVSEDLVDLVREVQRTIDSQKVTEMVKYLEDALAGGKQLQGEGAALPSHLQIPAQQDEAGPDEAGVAGDLLRAEEEPAETLGRPADDAGLVVAGDRGPLPQRDADGADESEGQQQERPFSGGAQGGRCHRFLPGKVVKGGEQ